MRTSGLILTAVGIGALLAAHNAENRFDTFSGHLATALSGKWRARRDLVLIGKNVALVITISGLVLTLIPED